MKYTNFMLSQVNVYINCTLRCFGANKLLLCKAGIRILSATPHHRKLQLRHSLATFYDLKTL